MRWNIQDKKIQANIKEPKLKNPLFDKENPTLNLDNFQIFFYLFILVLLITLYLFIYSPIFTIKEIEFKNLENISPINITENYLKTQLNSFHYFITHQNNIFIFDKSYLISNILKEYNLENILIEKKMPNKLIITINEKQPSLIYVTNNTNYYLDENGSITKKINEVISSDNNLPTIINLSNENVNIGQQIFSGDKLNNIVSIVNLTKDYSKLNIQNYEIPVLLSTQFNIYTSEGYKIYFDTSKSVNEQFNRLKRVLEETDSAQSPKEYIDLRIGERVYIK